MTKNRIGIAIVTTLIMAVTISSCTYRSYHPGYDRGYGYRAYPPPPPPRRVVVVRPAPPPRVVYRENRRAKHYYRGNSRNNSREYGHNGRTRGPR
ncbi:hypothetical protein [Dyadobacter luteus]|nr:hypothetical protein [Dyadobacter luteus]